MALPRISLSSKTLAGALALLAGCGLIYLAAPRTIAAFILLDGDPTLERLFDGEPVDGPAIDALVRSRRSALDWADRGDTWTDLAMAELLTAGPMAKAAERDKRGVKRAVRSLEEGLARSPINSRAWARLAYARYLLNGPSRAAAEALTMSLYTGSHDPELVFARIALCIGTWPYFSLDERDLVYREIRYAWKLSHKARLQIVDLAGETGGARVVRAALAAIPTDLAHFERRLRRRRMDGPRRKTEGPRRK